MQEAVDFTELYSKSLCISVASPNLELNTPFIFLQSGPQEQKAFVKSLKVMRDRQGQVMAMINEITVKEELISTTKISPQKKPIKEPSTLLPLPLPVLNNLHPIDFTPKRQTPKHSLRTQQTENNTKSTNKAVTFRLSEKDQESRVMPPSATSVTPNFFSKLKGKLESLSSCNYCSDTCFPTSLPPLHREPFEVEVTDTQLKTLITKPLSNTSRR